jgi:mycothiol synthase
MILSALKTKKIYDVSNLIDIRSFIKGQDEEVWLRIDNMANEEYEDFRPTTLDEFQTLERDPNFDALGMFIAEWKHNSVGCVNAFIDRKREENKGFIRNLSVIPKYRRKGIGTVLLKKAIQSLKDRGMRQVQHWTWDDHIPCIKLFESMGFQCTGFHSKMRRSLQSIPSNIGENKHVKIKNMQMSSTNIVLLNWLENEAFKEHPNFRPQSIDETRYIVEELPWFDIKEYLFAYMSGRPVGYIVLGKATRFIELKGVKRGWILDIGVIKPFRRRRVGTSLLLEALKYLKAIHLEEAELHVDDTNPTKAIELYRKIGFQVVKKSLTYLKNI